jgi:hypothetical protein
MGYCDYLEMWKRRGKSERQICEAGCIFQGQFGDESSMKPTTLQQGDTSVLTERTYV